MIRPLLRMFLQARTVRYLCYLCAAVLALIGVCTLALGVDELVYSHYAHAAVAIAIGAFALSEIKPTIKEARLW